MHKFSNLKNKIWNKFMICAMNNFQTATIDNIWYLKYFFFLFHTLRTQIFPGKYDYTYQCVLDVASKITKNVLGCITVCYKFQQQQLLAIFCVPISDKRQCDIVSKSRITIYVRKHFFESHIIIVSLKFYTYCWHSHICCSSVKSHK